MDGRALEAAEVSKLADLESREVLLAKLAGAMKGTLTKAAVVFNALPTQVARLAAALQEKKAAGALRPRNAAEDAPSPSRRRRRPSPRPTPRPRRSRPSRPDPTSTTRSDRRPAQPRDRPSPPDAGRDQK